MARARASQSTSAAPVWDLHPSVGMMRGWKEALEAKTGRSVAQWEALVRRDGPQDEKECRTWLRTEHGLSMSPAWFLATRVRGDGGIWDEDPEKYQVGAARSVDALFGAPGEPRRALFDALVAKARALGDDVRVCPCQTMVPLYRKYVFAEIRPTATGLEMAMALPGAKPGKRLQPLRRSSADRVDRRVLLDAPSDLDAEWEAWLRAAYAAGAETKKRETRADVPADLAAAMKKSAPARATWESMTPRMRSDVTAWIEDAKKADTRTRRVERALERLAAGKKSVY